MIYSVHKKPSNSIKPVNLPTSLKSNQIRGSLSKDPQIKFDKKIKTCNKNQNLIDFLVIYRNEFDSASCNFCGFDSRMFSAAAGQFY